MAKLFKGAERRRETRKSVNLPALALPGNTRCTVRDLSDGGCCIHLAQPSRLPQTVIIVLLDRGAAYQCSIRWRADDQVGVRFDRAADLRGIVPSVFVEAKAAWIRESAA
jgi:hypothetical protein